MSVNPVLAARSALGVASRYTANGAPDPVRVAAARRNLSAALVERAIRQALTAESPITPEQREQLAAGLPELKAYVQEMLDRWWSPGLICRQLKKAFPGRRDLHIVHETIYQALYIRGRGGLSRELVKCLRTGRDRRKPNRSIARRSSRFAERGRETGLARHSLAL